MSQRSAKALSLILLVPIGLFTKIYAGPGAIWVRNYFGGILYEIFWCLLAGWICSAIRPQKIAIRVFIITCALEVLQLWHPAGLEWMRSHSAGQILLGTTFDGWDFPHYAIGCLIGWWWLARIQNSPVGWCLGQ